MFAEVPYLRYWRQIVKSVRKVEGLSIGRCFVLGQMAALSITNNFANLGPNTQGYWYAKCENFVIGLRPLGWFPLEGKMMAKKPANHKVLVRYLRRRERLTL